jgi:two-component system sensor histidine kinase TctE
MSRSAPCAASAISSKPERPSWLRLGSLRGRLLVWLMLPLILLALALLVAAHLNAQQTAKRLFDKTLLAVTLAISEHVVRSDGDLLSTSFLEVVSASLRDQMYYHVLGPDGAFVTGYSDAPPLPGGAELAAGTPLFFDASYDGRPVRVVALRWFVAGPMLRGWLFIRVWQTTDERRALAREMLFQAVGSVGLLLTLAALAGWYGLKRSLRPLARLEADVARRGPRDLEPIGAEAPSELRQVVEALNRLLARLNAALAEQQHFIANASHQLRTPLTGLMTQAELTSRARDLAGIRASANGLLESARHVARLADQLLSLARIEAAGETGPAGEVDLVEVVREVARHYAARALGRGVELAFEAAPDVPKVRGDPLMLGEAVGNLIDNAIRYGAAGGEVTIEIETDEGWVIVTVVDAGPGIPPEAREQALRRFVRLAGGADGSGLGLAIVRDVAERHGGELELGDGPDGRGLAARLRIPVPNPAPEPGWRARSATGAPDALAASAGRSPIGGA